MSFNQDANLFTVTVEDLVNRKTYADNFDYVVNACGHFHTPNVPEFEGFSSFGGRVMHAHDFRDALEFKDKDILVVGTSYSAEDIASQCHKYGCKSVTISYRTAPMDFHWPDSFEQVPLLVKAEPDNTVHFKDGSKKKVDAIILCTGYLHHFPFLSEDLKLQTTNRLWPLDLYKGIFWEHNPQLMYLGMQDQFYTFNMFDAQAWYARDYILGKITLPSKEKMTADSLQWRAREEQLKNDEEMIWFQGDYVQHLIGATDYPSFDIEGVNKTFMEWEHHKHENIMNFRNNSYKSLMTGKMSPQHHTPWMEEMEDSMEAYLNNKIHHK